MILELSLLTFSLHSSLLIGYEVVAWVRNTQGDSTPFFICVRWPILHYEFNPDLATRFWRTYYVFISVIWSCSFSLSGKWRKQLSKIFWLGQNEISLACWSSCHVFFSVCGKRRSRLSLILGLGHNQIFPSCLQFCNVPSHYVAKPNLT